MLAQAACLLLLMHHCRSSCCSSEFVPVRRYHPATKYKTNNEDSAAAASGQDIQYAYAGGESGTEVDFTKGHTLNVSPPHDEQIGLYSSHGGTGFGMDSGPSGPGPNLQSSGSFGQAHVQGNGHGPYGEFDHLHTGEVDLTGADSDLEGTRSETGPGYGYQGPTGYEYGPPSVHSLPSITTPTPPPPPAQEAKQSPIYTYYYLGRHLWYIPLYFSIYFILYVGALVLKSVAKHKILFPENLKVAAAAAQGRALRQLDQGIRKFYMR